VRVPLERAEEARAELLEFAAHGFEERDLPGALELAVYGGPEVEEALRASFGEVSSERVEPGWEDNWRAFHRPVEIGRLWVGPPWEEAPEELNPVVIDPGRAFGTGAHPTTRLCLELLQELEPASLLDAGCGLADLLPFLESRGQRVRYVGADLTPAILKEARRRQPDADLVLTDLFAAPPFLPETFDVVFASGIFNLNLGNNDAFVQRAVPALARLAAGCVVANFLHAGAPVKHAHCHYYEPVPLMAALAGAGCRIDCREGYLDHDFTLVVWR